MNITKPHINKAKSKAICFIMISNILSRIHLNKNIFFSSHDSEGVILFFILLNLY